MPDALLQIAPLAVEGWTGKEPTLVPIIPMQVKYPRGHGVGMAFVHRALEEASATQRRLHAEGSTETFDLSWPDHEWSRLGRENTRFVKDDAAAVGRFYSAANEVCRALAYGELEARFVDVAGNVYEPPFALWRSTAALRSVVSTLGEIGGLNGRLYVTQDSLTAYLGSRKPAATIKGENELYRRIRAIVERQPTERIESPTLRQMLENDLGRSIGGREFERARERAVNEVNAPAWRKGGALAFAPKPHRAKTPDGL
ncbi:hypothetical protein MU852_04040 [Brevundimonas albigilva]|uniref:hypothetical protein n=1 Tax=Brevundimonas albigilva TaxID=1312364 RepID=UPI00201B949F|nr:hypothetical protein [Brevundimonas albigilva]UQV19041.1 hypothetical protein MU852_04040 [Brevundimonas albigilva]